MSELSAPETAPKKDWTLTDGFLFWLNQVSAAAPRNVAKQHAMVCAFITSAEYQLRFGDKVPRTNAECIP